MARICCTAHLTPKRRCDAWPCGNALQPAGTLPGGTRLPSRSSSRISTSACSPVEPSPRLRCAAHRVRTGLHSSACSSRVAHCISPWRAAAMDLVVVSNRGVHSLASRLLGIARGVCRLRWRRRVGPARCPRGTRPMLAPMRTRRSSCRNLNSSMRSQSAVPRVAWWAVQCSRMTANSSPPRRASVSRARRHRAAAWPPAAAAGRPPSGRRHRSRA